MVIKLIHNLFSSPNLPVTNIKINKKNWGLSIHLPLSSPCMMGGDTRLRVKLEMEICGWDLPIVFKQFNQLFRKVVRFWLIVLLNLSLTNESFYHVQICVLIFCPLLFGLVFILHWSLVQWQGNFNPTTFSNFKPHTHRSEREGILGIYQWLSYPFLSLHVDTFTHTHT